ncbi:MAG: hypothetical protein P8179_21295 [Candidatus Thiodiazotropha sp.]
MGIEKNMWRRKELEENKQYVLLLCEGEGRRFCCVSEFGSSVATAVYSTEVIPNEALTNYEFRLIEEHYKTTDGQRFGFGPHGEWATETEVKERLEYERYGPVSEYGDRIIQFPRKTYDPKNYRKILRQLANGDLPVYIRIPKNCTLSYKNPKGINESESKLVGFAQIPPSEYEALLEREKIYIRKFILPSGCTVELSEDIGDFPVELKYLLTSKEASETIIRSQSTRTW